MLEKVKGALRITTDVPIFNDEVQGLIDSCKLDLQIAGISETKLDEEDPLIERAIITYAKAHFGYDNTDADRFLRSYEMLKQHMSLSGEYNEA